ncbi:S-adenosyl-methyltransferase MraW [Anopheles sinensis]|uniref:S-adenosyl-methyltransferase MraW n=1 Tax=Anopheles sinensis TaxID=74873 RepID=A0A084WT73_ANOSI|nr:S-adenosyl-methyltransferase MraW [Anopheles sinensis]
MGPWSKPWLGEELVKFCDFTSGCGTGLAQAFVKTPTALGLHDSSPADGGSRDHPEKVM